MQQIPQKTGKPAPTKIYHGSKHGGLKAALARIVEIAKHANADPQSVLDEVESVASAALAASAPYYDEDLSRVGFRLMLSADQALKQRQPLTLRYDPERPYDERWVAVVGDGKASRAKSSQLYMTLGQLLEEVDPVSQGSAGEWRYVLADGKTSQPFRTEREAREAHARYQTGFARHVDEEAAA